MPPLIAILIIASRTAHDGWLFRGRLMRSDSTIRHGWFGHKDRFQQQFMRPIVAVVVHICEGGTYARLYQSIGGALTCSSRVSHSDAFDRWSSACRRRRTLEYADGKDHRVLGSARNE